MPIRWYAVVVQRQHEKVIAQGLDHLGYESYLPLYRSRRRWTDRIKEIELPLFPTYVFCRFPYPSRVRVLNLPGVRSIVHFGNLPAPIPDAEIAALQQTLASGLPVEPWPFLRVGERVRIERGPLRGLEGILVRVQDPWRLVLSVEMLRRSVAVQIDRSSISLPPK